METTLTAVSAAALLAHPGLPPIPATEGTALSGVGIAAVAGSATAPAYQPAFRLVTDSHTDATQVLPRGRPV